MHTHTHRLHDDGPILSHSNRGPKERVPLQLHTRTPGAIHPATTERAVAAAEKGHDLGPSVDVLPSLCVCVCVCVCVSE